MTRRAMPWPDRARSFIGHCLSEPLYRLFSLVPHWEVGLSTHEISRLTYVDRMLAGRRVVHLIELHLNRYQPQHDLVVAAIGELRPDWIFITGDLLNVPEGLPHLFRFLARLREIAPVFVTLGNHDHYSGVPIDRFCELADRHKITLLINQATFIPLDGGEIAIVGVDDPSLHRADLRCLPSPAQNRFIFLLAHAPNILDQLEEHHSVDLILCGHSHGGQWRIPGMPTIWLPPGCNGRIEGHYGEPGRRLYINRGLGWSFIPLRWNCTPEIACIVWIHAECSPAPLMTA